MTANYLAQAAQDALVLDRLRRAEAELSAALDLLPKTPECRVRREHLRDVLDTLRDRRQRIVTITHQIARDRLLTVAIWRDDDGRLNAQAYSTQAAARRDYLAAEEATFVSSGVQD